MQGLRMMPRVELRTGRHIELLEKLVPLAALSRPSFGSCQPVWIQREAKHVVATL